MTVAAAGPAPTDDDPAKHWSIRLRTDAYASIESEIDAYLADEEVDERATYVSRMVVEEIVRNLIEHTPPVADDETVDVGILVDDATVVVRIEDHRPPFDPLSGPGFDPTGPLESRRPGGMGLHLVRTLTDGLVYERVGDRNRLVATVRRR